MIMAWCAADGSCQAARDDETLMPGIRILMPGILAPITAMLSAARFIALPFPNVQPGKASLIIVNVA